MNIEITRLISAPEKDSTHYQAVILLDGIPMGRLIADNIRDPRFTVSGIIGLAGYVWRVEQLARKDIRAYLIEGTPPARGKINELECLLASGDSTIPDESGTTGKAPEDESGSAAGTEEAEVQQAEDPGNACNTDLKWILIQQGTEYGSPVFRIERLRSPDDPVEHDGLGSKRILGDAVADVYYLDSFEECRGRATRFLYSESIFKVLDNLIRELQEKLPASYSKAGEDWSDLLPASAQVAIGEAKFVLDQVSKKP